jgi:hypothetical protein
MTSLFNELSQQKINTATGSTMTFKDKLLALSNFMEQGMDYKMTANDKLALKD